MEAQMKQTKEHNEEQDDVSREGYENVELRNMYVWHHATSPRYPCRAELGRNESQKLQLQFRLIIHPHDGW